MKILLFNMHPAPKFCPGVRFATSFAESGVSSISAQKHAVNSSLASPILLACPRYVGQSFSRLAVSVMPEYSILAPYGALPPK